MLARHWQQKGVPVELLCLRNQPRDLWQEFEAIDIPIHTITLGSGLWRYLRLAWLSFRLCSWLRPQAVLSFPLGWHALIAIGARLARVQNVCAHVGNLPPVWTGRAFKKFKLLVQLGRPFTTRLLCCSGYITRAAIRDFGLRQHEVRCIYNACDLERFTAVIRTPATHQVQIGVVGRLDSNRDYQSMIKAIYLLRNQHLNVEGWLIGDGDGRRYLEELTDGLGLSNHVHFIGVQRDLPKLFQDLNIFIWPALELEGFGIALAEAMAAELPIVASDVGACREVLDGGRCGLLVEPGSAEALAAGIRQVLADPAATQQRAAAAKERALRDFSVTAMAEAYGVELGITPKPATAA